MADLGTDPALCNKVHQFLPLCFQLRREIHVHVVEHARSWQVGARFGLDHGRGDLRLAGLEDFCFEGCIPELFVLQVERVL